MFKDGNRAYRTVRYLFGVAALQSVVVFPGEAVLPQVRSVGGDVDVTAEAAVFTRTAEGNGECRFDLSWTFPGWEDDAYVFLPACAYDGNRSFAVREQRYPPVFRPDEIGDDPVKVISDVPKLNADGSGEINVTSGDLSVPCAGVYFPSARRGFLVFTEQQAGGMNVGFRVRKGEVDVCCPTDRKTAYRFCRPPCASPDRPMVLGRGATIPFRYKTVDFRADGLSDFYRIFYANRKSIVNGTTAPDGYMDEMKRLVSRRLDDDGWHEEGFWTLERKHPWKLGWTSGMNAAYGMLGAPDADIRAKVPRVVGYLLSTQLANGFFPFDDRWICPSQERPFTLVRREADGFFYLMKCLDRLPPNPRWDEGARRVADAFVRMWRKTGDWGFCTDFEHEKVLIGGTASAALVPAALIRAFRRLGNPEYREVAIAAGTMFAARFLDRGLVYGGPGDALFAPDSESAAALVESLVTIAEETRDSRWIEKARFSAHYLASWVVAYDYRFPEGCEFDRRGVRTTGSVFANVQNKHAAPGLCTMSGDALVRLSRLTDDPSYRKLFDEIANFIPQVVSTPERPVRAWGPPPYVLEPGWINERVNLGDWQGTECVGGVFRGPCWSQVAFMNVCADRQTCRSELAEKGLR